MSSHLAEILKQKKQAWLNYREMSRFEIENWNNKVRELYEQIKEWLRGFENDGLLRFKDECAPAIETEVKYCFTIEWFNGQTIEFEPVLNIVGAYGRVDMQLGLHKVMIILKEKNGSWIFAERYNREEPTIYEFNQENFEQIVTDFVEGF